MLEGGKRRTVYQPKESSVRELNEELRRQRDQNIEIEKIEMIYSLLKSVKEARGDWKSIIANFDELTLNDLVETLAQNGIRFCFKRKDAPGNE